MLGMKCEEIAEILVVPAGTVRSRLHYALIELKSELKKSFPGFEKGVL
jgi:DNA-directed RNA polymerase specialized sigma24 family protein